MATTKTGLKKSAKKETPPKAVAKKLSKPRPRSAVSNSDRAANAVDEQLARYRDMRDFHITSEPSGKIKSNKKSGPFPFVIQKHAASHLHYDFRLGWNGVLKSWAVAKGPSYYTGDRRLAVQVEDHPMEYGGFEGIIPQGQYGGGTVMVWDQGTWEPQPGHEDVDGGLRDGSLKFIMHGAKMKGKWTLIRMSPHAGGKYRDNGKPNWLLIKEHDDFERSKDDPCITEEKPNSAVTGRSLEQIAKHEDHVWNSKETAQGNAWYRQVSKSKDAEESPPAKAKSTLTTAVAKSSPVLSTLPKESQPTFISPQLALEASTPPEGDGWLHELKLDGYRIQARKDGRKVQMLTRKGLDWTHRIPSVAEAIARLSAKQITLDGEVVVLGPDGTTNFADLQAAFQEGARKPLTYFCFDLLHLDGRNTRALGLRQRKALLAGVLSGDEGDLVRLSEHLETGGEEMFHKACELHAEGIISKRASAPYKSSRSGDWLKSKCLREQEFVIGGYTFSSDGEDRIGSLLLGYYRDKKLIYAGRTGTGFTQKTRHMLRTRLGAMEVSSVPFELPPVEAKRGAIWVRPELVAQVRFATWTADNLLRQAAFLGLREDKPAAEVAREEPNVAPRPKGSTRAAPIASTQALVKSKADIAARTMPKSSAKMKKIARGPMEHPPVRLTHPEKTLDDATGLTKQQLADYYWAVAPHMLPHIADRPLSLVRCPEGSTRPCFYQKHVNHMLPKGIGSVDIVDKKSGKPEPYITLNTAEALAGLAQMGVLEVHPWGSHNDDLEHPDRIIFDLDPDEAISWSVLTSAAAEVRKRLKAIGLESWLKTTGGKGLHVVVPVKPRLAWPEVKQFAYAFVLQMERANPSLYLTKMTKAARRGKIYLDYLRNERGATSVAPFSPRARTGAPVALPLAWHALKLPQRPLFHVAAFNEWRSRITPDPWKDMPSARQGLAIETLAAVGLARKTA